MRKLLKYINTKEKGIVVMGVLFTDLILVMKDNDTVESGNHCELLSKNGIYA